MKNELKRLMAVRDNLRALIHLGFNHRINTAQLAKVNKQISELTAEIYKKNPAGVVV